MIDLRSAAQRARGPVTSALLPRVLPTAEDVLGHVQFEQPDLVWLYAGEMRATVALARRILDTGVDVVIIDDSLDDDLEP